MGNCEIVTDWRADMAVYELLMRSMEERNAEHYIEALHDDYEFVRHQSGTTMDKAVSYTHLTLPTKRIV